MKQIVNYYHSFVKSVRHSLVFRSFVDFYSHNAGFTIIEILVTLTILAAFAAGMILTLDPKSQIEKAENAARLNNLKEIKNAIQVYYEDNKCYPGQVSSLTQALVEGGEWRESGIIYMQEIVKRGDEGSIIYLTDPDSECPQWNVIFSKLASTPEAQTCPLVEFPDVCTPPDYNVDEDEDGEPDVIYACVLSGAVDCPFINNETTLASAYAAGDMAQNPTPTTSQGGGSGGGQGAGGSAPTPTPTPTNTPVEPLPGGQDWFDTSSAIPNATGGYIAPYAYNGQTYNPPDRGELQYFDVIVNSPESPEVQTVTLLVVNDSTNMTNQATQDATATRYYLNLLSGTPNDGVWGGLWEVEYDLQTRYKIILLLDDGTNESRVEIPFYGYYEPGA